MLSRWIENIENKIRIDMNIYTACGKRHASISAAKWNNVN